MYSTPGAEKQILAVVMRATKGVRTEVLCRLEKDYFSLKEAKFLYDCLSVWDWNGTGKYDWFIAMIDAETRKRMLKEEERKNILSFVESVWNTEVSFDPTNIEKLISVLREFAQGRKLVRGMEQALEILDSGQPAQAVAYLRDCVMGLDEALQETVDRHDYFSSVSERLTWYNDDTRKDVPVGILPIDRMLGKLARGSLCYVYGETSVGKSLFLQEVALGVALCGYRSLYVSIEMSLQELSRRLDSRITGIPLERLKEELGESEKRVYLERLRDYKGKLKVNGGSLGISYLPEAFTVGRLHREVDYWSSVWNKGVDVVVVDYADMMSPSKNGLDGEQALGQIFRDLKELAGERDCVVWTASQQSKQSYGRTDLKSSAGDYSMRKLQVSDIALGLSYDDEEEISRVWVAKNREGKRGYTIILHPDFQRAAIHKE